MSTVFVEERLMQQLVDALRQCSDELAAELDAKHAQRHRYDVVRQAYRRDMAPVEAARILLEQMRE